MSTDQRKRELGNQWHVILGCLLIGWFVALPFIANFAAGAIAGVSEILTFYPLGESHLI